MVVQFPRPRTSILSKPPGELVLRINDPRRAGELIQLKSAKCSVGSSPHCTLRMQAIGVRPLHCLIVRSAETTVIRNLCHEAQLNGRLFEDAALALGDRLRLGTIELEVVSLGGPTTLSTPVSPAARTTIEPPHAKAALTPRSEIWPRSTITSPATAPTPAAPIEPTPPPVAATPTREEAPTADRNRRLLRKSRRKLKELQQAIDTQAATTRHFQSLHQQAQRELGNLQNQLHQTESLLTQQATAREHAEAALQAKFHTQQGNLQQQLANLQAGYDQLQADIAKERQFWQAQLAAAQDEQTQAAAQIVESQRAALLAQIREEQADLAAARQVLANSEAEWKQAILQADHELQQREAEILQSLRDADQRQGQQALDFEKAEAELQQRLAIIEAEHAQWLDQQKQQLDAIASARQDDHQSFAEQLESEKLALSEQRTDLERLEHRLHLQRNTLLEEQTAFAEAVQQHQEEILATNEARIDLERQRHRLQMERQALEDERSELQAQQERNDATHYVFEERRSDLDAAQHQLAEKSAQLQQAEEALNQAQANFASEHAALLDERRQFEAAQQSLATLREELEAARELHQADAAALAQQQATLQAAHEQLLAGQEKHAQAQATLATEAAAARQQIVASQSQFDAERQAQLANLENELATRQAQWQSEFEAQKSALAARNAELDSVRESLDQQHQALAAREKNLEANQAALGNTQAEQLREMETLRQTLTDEQARLVATEQQVAQATTLLAERDDAVVALQDQLETTKREQLRLAECWEHDKHQQREQIEAIELELYIRSKQISDHLFRQSELASTNEQLIRELNAACTAHEAAQAAWKQERAAIEVERTTALQLLDEQQLETQRLTAQHQVALADATAPVAAQGAELESLQAQLAEQIARATHLEAALNESQSHTSTAQAELDSLRALPTPTTDTSAEQAEQLVEIEKLRGEIATLRARLETASEPAATAELGTPLYQSQSLWTSDEIPPATAPPQIIREEEEAPISAAPQSFDPEDPFARLRKLSILRDDANASATESIEPPHDSVPLTPEEERLEDQIEDAIEESQTVTEVHSSEPKNETEEVEDYMQQLLSRLRNEQPTGRPADAKPNVHEPVLQEAPVAAAAEPAEPKDESYLTELVPRNAATDHFDMHKLRELANSQTRTVLNLHRKKVVEENMRTKQVVALMTAIISGVALWLSEKANSSAAAGLGLSVSTYWLWQARCMSWRLTKSQKAAKASDTKTP